MSNPPGQMASHLPTWKPSCSASFSKPQPAWPPCTQHTLPAAPKAAKKCMYHSQAYVTEMASPESAGETLGVSGGGWERAAECSEELRKC